MGLAYLVLITFSPTLFAGFINLDDSSYIIQNSHVTSGLSLANFQWSFTDTSTGQWIPLTWLSLMLDSSLFGAGAQGYHLDNVILHTAGSIVLMLALHQATGSVARSFLAAALFAMHPLRVESVAWVVERKDVLAGLFASAALWAYVRYARTGRRRHYLLCCLAYALSLAAKPALAAGLPAVLWLLDYWPLRRLKLTVRSMLTHAAEKLPLAALTVFSTIATLVANAALPHPPGAMGPVVPGIWLRLENLPIACCRYLLRMVWFGNLAVYYPMPPSISPLAVAGCAVLILALCVIAFAIRRRRPWVTVGWFWFAIALLPMSGIAYAGVPVALADRFTYFPSIGLAIAAAWSVPVAASRLRADIVAVTVVLLALCSFSVIQCFYFIDSDALWSHAEQVIGPNWLSQFSLGESAAARGDPDSLKLAEDHYARSVELHPNFPYARARYALLLASRGEDAESLRQCGIALSQDPRLALAHEVRGIALGHQGKLAEARREYQIATDLAL